MRGKASEPARLLIADDHDLVREGTRVMLAREPDLEVTGEATNGREALELCRRLCPDLVLMDVRMPEMDGIEATRKIKGECPATSVLMLTAHESPDYLLDAIRAGAAGYVLKDATRQQLLDAVRGALDGEFPLNQNLAMRLLRRLADEEAERREPRREETPPEPEKKTPEPLLEPLTPRETEVLSLLARGRTNCEIAETLVISPGTAKLHVHRVINKLGASDRTQAAIRAIRLGLPSLN